MKRNFQVLFGVVIGFAFGVLATLQIHSVAAQTPPLRGRSLELGTITLRIGMPKTQVVSLLSKDFLLENTGDIVNGNEFWLVNGKADRFKKFGDLQFKNERLVAATRDWDEIDADARTAAFLKSLHAALQHLIGQNTAVVRAKAQISRRPGTEHYQVDFYTQDGNITFAVIDNRLPNGDFYRTAVVEEAIPGS